MSTARWARRCNESGVRWKRESISKSRRALFGDDFRETYDLLQNRFLFVENGNDDHLFLRALCPAREFRE